VTDTIGRVWVGWNILHHRPGDWHCIGLDDADHPVNGSGGNQAIQHSRGDRVRPLRAVIVKRGKYNLYNINICSCCGAKMQLTRTSEAMNMIFLRGLREES